MLVAQWGGNCEKALSGSGVGSLLYQDGEVHFGVRVHDVFIGFRYGSQTRNFGGHVMACVTYRKLLVRPQSGPANGFPASPESEILNGTNLNADIFWDSPDGAGALVGRRLRELMTVYEPNRHSAR